MSNHNFDQLAADFETATVEWLSHQDDSRLKAVLSAVPMHLRNRVIHLVLLHTFRQMTADQLGEFMVACTPVIKF